MIRDFICLARVQLLGMLNSFAPNAQNLPRRVRARRLALIGLLALMVCGVLAAYMVLTGIGLASMGLADAIPPLAVVAGSIAGVIFTFMKARGVLFGARDHDLVMSLPISRRVVVVARMATLFGSAIALAALFMAPLYAVYFATTGADAARVACATVSILLAPLAPTALSTFAAFAVTAISARFRHANLAYIVVALLAMLALVFGSSLLSFASGMDRQGTAAAMMGTIAGLQDGIVAAWPPAAWATAAIVRGEFATFGLFVLVNLGVAALCVEIMQRCYLSINGMLAGRRHRAGGGALRLAPARSPFWALVLKEFRTLLGIPSYAFNCLFGYLLMVGIAVALAVLGVRNLLTPDVINGVDAAVLASLVDRAYLLLPWAFAFCATTGASSTISISLEGRAAWLMATAPLGTATVIGAKLASNALPVGCSLGASVLIMLASGQVDALCALEVLVVGAGLFYLWANVGIAIDAARPNFSWTSPNEIVKRSAPITVSVVGGMVCEFGLGALCVGVLPAVAPIAAVHAVTLAVGIVAGAIGQLLFLRTVRTARFYIA